MIWLMAVGGLKAEEGFIRGSCKFMVNEINGQREKRQLDFVLACDQDCCLAGAYLRTLQPLSSEPYFEKFALANKGNEHEIEITVDRKNGSPLTTGGNWSAKYIMEVTRLKLEDSFESRYKVAMMGASSLISLPVYLSWDEVGITRDAMTSALQGRNFRGTNDLGSLEITGLQGIGQIRLRKSASSIHSLGWVSLSKVSTPLFPNGLKSIEKEYSFTPERKSGERELFRCVGKVTETAPDGKSRITDMDIQLTENSDGKKAREFIDAVLRKLPEKQRIISNSNLTTVMAKGVQRVVVDRDVEGVAINRFRNLRPLMYYGVILFTLIASGLVGYLIWSKKAF
jgi:hypothetical protein